MNVFDWAKLLILRFQVQQRDTWNKTQILNYQQKTLQKLREHAYANSAFYSKFHKGLQRAPLSKLPVLTKATLMENWNEIITDQSVKLDEVEKFLASFDSFKLFNERYFVSSTGGTTGKPGVFVYAVNEWLESVIISYIRSNDWTGVKAGVFNKIKIGVVSTRNLRHQSALVSYTLKNSPASITLSIDSTEPIEKIVNQLNDFQPRSLVAYANMAKLLAQLQIKGQLKIHPEVVICSSEVLTSEAKQLIKQAWNVEPFNVYAATETATIASECIYHKLHLFEDFVITEVVNGKYAPVKTGETGSKLLVTVLNSRTLPLIRYELSDNITLSNEKCKCGKPFNIVASVEGRSEDVLHLKDERGKLVSIQPNVFHDILMNYNLSGWQVIQSKNNEITISVIKSSGKFDEKTLINEITRALVKREVEKPKVKVKFVAKLMQTKRGKTPLVIALKNT